MPQTEAHGRSRGRLRAASCCIALTFLGGCTSSGSSPLGASLNAILFGGNTTAEAEKVPYASLDATLGDIRGLMVMGAQAGDVTYWPAQEGIVLELADGGLHALRGRDAQLLGSTYRPAPPWQQSTSGAVTLIRHVQDQDGDLQRYQAEGTPHCEPARLTKLPLNERLLEICRLQWHWTSGDITSATYWRAPETHRLWATTETAWPDGPEVSWRVARHWW